MCSINDLSSFAVITHLPPSSLIHTSQDPVILFETPASHFVQLLFPATQRICLPYQLLDQKLPSSHLHFLVSFSFTLPNDTASYTSA